MRAATTLAATIDLTLSEGNVLSLKCKNEGVVGNGVEVESVLKVGYAAKIVAGDAVDTFKLQIFRGSFSGVDKDGEPFGVYPIDKAVPNMIAESPDLNNFG